MKKPTQLDFYLQKLKLYVKSLELGNDLCQIVNDAKSSKEIHLLSDAEFDNWISDHSNNEPNEVNQVKLIVYMKRLAGALNNDYLKSGYEYSFSFNNRMSLNSISLVLNITYEIPDDVISIMEKTPVPQYDNLLVDNYNHYEIEDTPYTWGSNKARIRVNIGDRFRSNSGLLGIITKLSTKSATVMTDLGFTVDIPIWYESLKNNCRVNSSYEVYDTVTSKVYEVGLARKDKSNNSVDTGDLVIVSTKDYSRYLAIIVADSVFDIKYLGLSDDLEIKYVTPYKKYFEVTNNTVIASRYKYISK